MIGAILLLPLGLLFIRGVVRVLRLPQWCILAAVVMISLVGTYAIARQILDLAALVGFGAVGYALRKAGFPIAPIVIGFVLGPIFEANYRRTWLIAQGDLLGYLASRPITLVVLVAGALALLLPLLQTLTGGRGLAFPAKPSR